jgi:nucleotide-binding universal stress UspA family protein
MDRCVDKLLEWHPDGIAEITVLTAFPDRTAMTVSHLMPEMSVNIRPWIQERLAEKNEKLATRIRDAMPVATSSIVTEEPASKAIADVMRNTEADLLILGAQGHGFFGRAMLGSISYPLAVYDDHSVLVIRAGDSGSE